MKKIKKLERKDKRNGFKDCAKLKAENEQLKTRLVFARSEFLRSERENEQLKAQIEKMKCSKNCLTFGVFKCPAQSDKTIKSCIGCKDWKLKEIEK